MEGHWCWRCGWLPGPEAPLCPRCGAAQAPPSAAGWAPPPEQAPERHPLTWLGLTGAGIVAVVGMVSLIIGVGPTGRASPTTNVELAVPARLGGMSRVADRAGHDAEDAVTRRLQVLLPDAIAGLYLDERTGESVVLVASRHAGDKLTAADLVPAVAVAARQEIGIGATVSVDRLQPIPRDGAAYLCGATTGRIDSAVCMWRADGVVAVLLGLSSASPDELATWSAAAHQALRG